MTVFQSCRVLKVVDADTLDFSINFGSGLLGVSLDVVRRVRVAGINCPEVNTAEGKEAKAYVESLLKPSTFATIWAKGKDRYGRLVADVVLPEVGDLAAIR